MSELIGDGALKGISIHPWCHSTRLLPAPLSLPFLSLLLPSQDFKRTRRPLVDQRQIRGELPARVNDYNSPRTLEPKDEQAPLKTLVPVLSPVSGTLLTQA